MKKYFYSLNRDTYEDIIFYFNTLVKNKMRNSI
jgi:hypothetical protein